MLMLLLSSYIFKLSASAGLRLKSGKGEGSRTASMQKVHDMSCFRYFTMLVMKLKSQKAEKLVLMGTVVSMLLVCMLAINLSTAPELETFKSATEEWRDCTVEFRTYCPSYRTCRASNDYTCNNHDECFEQYEYCTDQGVCAECFECALKENGIQGTCPEMQCTESALMNPQVDCAFSSCAAEIADCTNTEGGSCFTQGNVPLQSFLDDGPPSCEADNSCDFNSRLGSVAECLRPLECHTKMDTCSDPYRNLEGCSCVNQASDLVVSDKLLLPVETGCHGETHKLFPTYEKTKLGLFCFV